MRWAPIAAAVINAAFILDLASTLATGKSLGSLLWGASGGSVGDAIVKAMPTDPLVFWTAAGFVLAFVCAIECVAIYAALYPGRDDCRCCMEASA